MPRLLEPKTPKAGCLDLHPPLGQVQQAAEPKQPLLLAQSGLAKGRGLGRAQGTIWPHSWAWSALCLYHGLDFTCSVVSPRGPQPPKVRLHG